MKIKNVKEKSIGSASDLVNHVCHTLVLMWEKNVYEILARPTIQNSSNDNTDVVETNGYRLKGKYNTALMSFV